MDWEWRKRSSGASSVADAVERRKPRRLRRPRARRKEKSALASRSPVCSASVTSRYKRRRPSASPSSPPLPLPPSSVEGRDDPSPPAGSASFRLIPTASGHRRRHPPLSPSQLFFYFRFCPWLVKRTEASFLPLTKSPRPVKPSKSPTSPKLSHD
jgi:hypothetical protein